MATKFVILYKLNVADLKRGLNNGKSTIGYKNTASRLKNLLETGDYPGISVFQTSCIFRDLGKM